MRAMTGVSAWFYLFECEQDPETSGALLAEVSGSCWQRKGRTSLGRGVLYPGVLQGQDPSTAHGVQHQQARARLAARGGTPAAAGGVEGIRKLQEGPGLRAARAGTRSLHASASSGGHGLVQLHQALRKQAARNAVVGALLDRVDEGLLGDLDQDAPALGPHSGRAAVGLLSRKDISPRKMSWGVSTETHLPLAMISNCPDTM